MENSDVNNREPRPSTLLNSEDVRRERALSLKRSRAGHLGALTKAQNEVETLLRDEDSSNVTLVKEKFDYYETLWKNFVVSHNKFMDVAERKKRLKMLNVSTFWLGKGLAYLQVLKNLFAMQRPSSMSG